MKNKTIFYFLNLFIWILSILAIAWLWDHWFLDGPYGNYRWVGTDFAPYWIGTREIINGVNPYNAETNLKIQELVYGGKALSYQDPMMFVYPAWIFIVILPFTILPYKWAVILYEGSLLWVILLFLQSIAMTLENEKISIQSFWLILLVIGSLPFMVISIIKGQLGYLSLLALFIIYKLWKKYPIFAGFLLGFSLIKPTVIIIPILGILLWVLINRNWKFLISFLTCILLLLGISFLMIGNWIANYINIISIKGGMPTLWSFSILPKPYNYFYASIFIVIGIISFLYSLANREHDYWFSAIILMGIALTPMRWIYDLFLGILILTEKRKFTRLQYFMIGLTIISPWILIFIPGLLKWKIAVVGFPLLWAVILLMFIFSENMKIKCIKLTE